MAKGMPSVMYTGDNCNALALTGTGTTSIGGDIKVIRSKLKILVIVNDSLDSPTGDINREMQYIPTRRTMVWEEVRLLVERSWLQTLI